MRSLGTRRVAALACTVGLLTACGSDGSGKRGADTTPVTATTSTAAPQPTTTLAPAPTTPATEPAATTAPTASRTTTVGAAPTTDATDTTDGSNTTTVGSVAPVSTVAEYTEVSPPKVPSTSAPVLADNTHPDGVYYATVTEGGDPPPAAGAVVFELVQLFVGPDCTAHFGAQAPDLCVNDYGVETEPTSTIEVPLARQYVSVADAATQQSYRVSGPELYGLIHGDQPSAGAPEGYEYSGFGYFLTFTGGKVTRLEQWWTP